MTRPLTPRLATAAPAIAILALCCAAAIPPAHAAQIFENVLPTTAPVLDIDPSVRSLAMGGASGAVFWGGDANHWSNPALLGLAQGMRYERSDVNPVPALLSDARFRTRRTTLGYGGIGVAVAGEPVEGFGESRLELGGLSTGGSPLTLTETVRTWSAGVSAAGVAQSIARLRGHDAPALTHRLDVAFGLGRKQVEDPSLDPQSPERATCWDWGVLARGAMPLEETGWLSARRLELALAYSVLNSNDVEMFAAPTARHHRQAVALHADFGRVSTRGGRIPQWLAPGLEPLVSAGIAADIDRVTAGSRDRGTHPGSGCGAEIAVANILFLRTGYADTGLGEFGATWGIGAGLPLGRWAALRYDHAHVARNSFRGDIDADSWSVWLDPFAVYRDAR